MSQDASDKNLPVPVEDKGDSGSPPVLVSLPPAQRIDLSNYRDIRLEMARVYRVFDQKKLGESDAKSRIYMLGALAQLIKATETDQRLEAIERVMNMRRTYEREACKPTGHPLRNRFGGR